MDRDAARPAKSRSGTETSAMGRVVVRAGRARLIDGGNLPVGLISKQNRGALTGAQFHFASRDRPPNGHSQGHAG